MMTTVGPMEAVAKLRPAVRDPFLILYNAPEGADPLAWQSLWEWVRYARAAFPLSCIRPSAYAALNDGDLPATHPLSTIVRSIIEDEGPEDSSRRLSLQGVEGLALVLDSRRCGLSHDGLGGGFTDQISKEADGFRLAGSFGFGFARLLDGPVLASYEEDTEYSVGGYISPYEDIGLRLVQLIEARDAARSGSLERRGANMELRRFLGDVAALQSPGRPTDLREHVVRRIVDEGQQLLRVVVAALAEPIELSESTREVLAAFVVPSSGMVDWALRLVLPVFSQPEVLALRRGIENGARRGASLDGLAMEFAVQLLAHRLRRTVGGIARKATNGWTAEMISASGSRCEICGLCHDG